MFCIKIKFLQVCLSFGKLPKCEFNRHPQGVKSLLLPPNVVFETMSPESHIFKTVSQHCIILFLLHTPLPAASISMLHHNEGKKLDLEEVRQDKTSKWQKSLHLSTGFYKTRVSSTSQKLTTEDHNLLRKLLASVSYPVHLRHKPTH